LSRRFLFRKELLTSPELVETVQTYPVRASHRKNLDPAALATLMRAHFDGVETDGPSVSGRWGAVDRIVVRAEKRDLAVDVTMNPKVAEEVARETIARYNRFLEDATGYSSKERAKRLRKSATAAPSGD
jgi:hypothetical protein